VYQIENLIFGTSDRIEAEPHVTEFSKTLPLSVFGWDRVQNDLIDILDHVLEKYKHRTNPSLSFWFELWWIWYLVYG